MIATADFPFDAILDFFRVYYPPWRGWAWAGVVRGGDASGGTRGLEEGAGAETRGGGTFAKRENERRRLRLLLLRRLSWACEGRLERGRDRWAGPREEGGVVSVG